ncbi:MAG TPA: multicopper oxidase domain-containing protein, partial [Gemmatimonadaceae bacterium]|nr:multicopper oxidase domain-containing protein [Gemmatimonadaceae bacterium]
MNNDNRIPAGELRDGVLTVRLEARSGVWYPEGPRGIGRSVAAFAEVGQPLQNPGPLIRVPAGTRVVVTVRNSLSEPITLHGLGQQRGIQPDSVQVEPGGVREVRFTATEPGTYWYAGRTMPAEQIFASRGLDSQLNGAIVVDPPGTDARAARDRVFLITWAGRATAQANEPDAPVMAINGASWPHTERFDVMQGDSLHWRWINMTGPPHPMHLHGFYFRVDGRGDGAQFSYYPPDQRRSAVTETVRRGETMHIAWSPSKPGNWLVHCHIARHMSPQAALLRDRRMPVAAHTTHGRPHSADAEHMAKLVLGITVRPRGETAVSSGAARPIRLLIRSGPRVYGEYAGYGYVLGGSPAEADPSAFSIPGPTLVLEKDEPVEITLVNQSHEPAAVHWHGIELDSYPDGVPGWSGDGANVLPAVASGDSLTVRFTPPRAGTFMYHSHFNEHQQISSGLYGAIIVLDSAQRFDPETDRVLLFSDAAPTLDTENGPFSPPLLNGRDHPE